MVLAKEVLKELFHRDLEKLKQEIKLYKDETTLWKTENSIKNSGGNLCLHIIGNLKTYIGNGLSQIGYQRHRELEFSAKNIDRIKIYKEIDETIHIVNYGIDKLNEEQFNGDFPMVIWEKETGMVFTLIHLHSHLNYHLGQINYLRRILEEV
ncbi:MAG: DUF1572 family protein [Cellulophaga sp.]